MITFFLIDEFHRHIHRFNLVTLQALMTNKNQYTEYRMWNVKYQ